MVSAFTTIDVAIAATGGLALAALGFWLARRGRVAAAVLEDPKLVEELQRAERIGAELADVVRGLCAEATQHAASIAVFRERIRTLQFKTDSPWQYLGEQADGLLTPTMKLATGLTLVHDQLRRCQAQLMTYSGARVDLATGLYNRRSMDEHLAALLSTAAAGKRRLALALFSTAPNNAPSTGSDERQFSDVAAHLVDCVRGNDFVARYSHDEFVVIMPQTTLAGAMVFCERLIRLAHAQLGINLHGGVVEAAGDETPERLLSRADSALYSARTQADACLFQHNGTTVRRHAFELCVDSEHDALVGAP